MIRNLAENKNSNQIEPGTNLLPAVNCRQRFSHAEHVGKVDSKILHFKEVDCILLVVFLRTGEEEAGLLSLDILLEVEVKGVLKVGEDGQVGVLPQVQDDCCAKQEHRISIPPGGDIEFVSSGFGASSLNNQEIDMQNAHLAWFALKKTRLNSPPLSVKFAKLRSNKEMMCKLT